MDHKVLSGLSRPQIQKLAKQAGLKANDRKEDIILRLLATDAERVPPPVEEVKIIRRSKRVARQNSTSYVAKQETVEMAGVAGVATEVSEVVAPGHAEASGSKAHQGGKAVRGLRQSASKRPRALKLLDVRSGASSSQIGKVAGNVDRLMNASAAASAHSATTHDMMFQQTEQGSSSRGEQFQIRPINRLTTT
ncbi:hypothetical protein B0H21DRAFT_308908 [Amylocystis lapponica]|nr:hypothetical protein B0H21DRAFT_308908 [Amylocystis lapponica]